MHDIRRIVEIRDSRDKVANLLSPSAKAAWYALRWVNRFMAYKGKELFIFTLDREHNPTVSTILTCHDVSLYADTGLTSEWKKSDGTYISVDSTPYEVLPSVFLWHPSSSEIQFREFDGKINTRFSMVMRTRHSPNYGDAEPNTLFMLDRATFQKEFAQ